MAVPSEEKISAEGFRPLDEYRYYAFYCNRCGNCKIIDAVYLRSSRFSQICPAFGRYLFDAYSAQGKMDIALAMLDGTLGYTPKMLDVIYRCMLCGGCDVMCKRSFDSEPLLVLESLRIKAVTDGKGPMPEHVKLRENLEKTNNIYGESHGDRLRWVPKEIKPAKKADILYFVGCASAYRRREIAQATAQIFKAAGVEFMVSENERCCGYHMFSTGQVDAARRLVEHNLDMIEKSGAEKVITSCASCYKTIKVDYPKILRKSTKDLGFEILHITEFLDQSIKSGAIKLPKSIEMRVTYHDPCLLGRQGEPWEHWEGTRDKWGSYKPQKKWRRGTYGIYTPPRDVLGSIQGIELREMGRVRENAWCCGAGGGVKQAFPDFALWVAKERLEEAKTTGAEAIITACPFCKENLEDAIEAGKEAIRVYDITELVVQALGEEGLKRTSKEKLLKENRGG